MHRPLCCNKLEQHVCGEIGNVKLVDYAMSTIHRPISTFILAQNLTFLQPFYKIVATQTAIKQLTLKLLSLSAFRSDSKLFKVFENARNTRYSLITSSNIGIAAAIFLLPRFDAVSFSGRPLRVADDSLWF